MGAARAMPSTRRVLKKLLHAVLPPPVFRAVQRGWRLALTVFWWPTYRLTLGVLRAANEVFVRTRRKHVYENSVLHVSYPIHTAHATVQILRRRGLRADYLAVGHNQHWSDVDFRAPASPWPHVQAWREFRMFWNVVAKYEVVHCHFMHTMSRTGWELPYLKRLGRTIVAHYRGCEIRDRDRNMRLHPDVNICQECDYNGTACLGEFALRAKRLGPAHADLAIVTTPDMKDFVPNAVHLRFFSPDDQTPPVIAATRSRNGRPFRIVHATNHPGIEGTEAIRRVIDSLRAKGHAIEFVFLRDASHKQVLDALADADLAIGKMKMGYYANFQIESMSRGVPTVTFVRPEFMTPDLEQSGFIFSTLADLEQTIEHYLTHPSALEEKRRIARQSILALHDNDRLATELIQLYRRARTTR